MSLRESERDSIRAFVQWAAHSGYFAGRVLDFGCGRQPYREIVEQAGGEYIPFDRQSFPGNVSGEDVGDTWHLGEYDAILCTQVVQYIPLYPYYDGLQSVLGGMYESLSERGHLVMTYPTHWPEVEVEDRHRFTKSGMEELLAFVGFEVILHVQRHAMAVEGEALAYGYGVVARP